MMLLCRLPQHTVEARLRTQINTLISQPGHDLARWQAAETRATAHRQDALTLFRRQSLAGGRAYRRGASVRCYCTLFQPALVGPHTDTGFLAGAPLAGACING